MRKKIKKYILLLLIVIIGISAIVGYKIWNKPHLDIKKAASVKISATALYSNLTTDSARMKPAFYNKVISVSGVVKEVIKNQQNQQVILLKTNVPGGSVNCTMEENAENIIAGEMIALKGICSGYIAGDVDMDLPGDVFLIRCYRAT